jgi:hypothetical protein
LRLNYFEAMTPIDHLFGSEIREKAIMTTPREDPTAKLREILHAYTAITGNAVAFEVWQFRLYEFCKHHNLNEFIGVLKFMIHSNKSHDWKYSLALGKLLDLERFQDLLGLARAHYRSHPKTSARAKILADWRGFEQNDTSAIKTVGQVLARMGDKV